MSSMKYPRLWLGIALCVVAAAGGYALSVSTRPTTTTQPAADDATELFLDWLQVSPSQRSTIRQREPRFGQELKQLRETMQAQRQALAAALQDPQTPEQEIREKHEAAIAAGNAMERRVVDYLLTVRDHLTPEQQRRLAGLCAQGVTQGQWRWRHGQQGGGPGGGPGAGGGRGRGWGRNPDNDR